MLIFEEQIFIPYSKLSKQVQLIVFQENKCCLTIKRSRGLGESPQDRIQSHLIQFGSNKDLCSQQKNSNQQFLKSVKFVDLQQNSFHAIQRNNIINPQYTFLRVDPKNQLQQQQQKLKHNNFFNSKSSQIFNHKAYTNHLNATYIKNKSSYIGIEDRSQEIYIYGFEYDRRGKNKSVKINLNKKKDRLWYQVFHFLNIYNIDDSLLLSHVQFPRFVQNASLCLVDLQYQKILHFYSNFKVNGHDTNEQLYDKSMILLSKNHFCAGSYNIYNNNYSYRLFDKRSSKHFSILSTPSNEIDDMVFNRYNVRSANNFVRYKETGISLDKFKQFNLMFYIQNIHHNISFPVLLDVRKPNSYIAVEYDKEREKQDSFGSAKKVVFKYQKVYVVKGKCKEGFMVGKYSIK